jgi:hypothetical protein
MKDRKNLIDHRDAFPRGPLWFGAGLVFGALWPVVKRVSVPDSHCEQAGYSATYAEPATTETPEFEESQGGDIAASAEGGDSSGRWFIPSARTLAPFVLGVALLVTSSKLYSNVVSPTQAPIVPGHAELYVQDPSVLAHLSATFPLGKTRRAGSKVYISLAFRSTRQVAGVAWALVMSGDACFAEQGGCISSVNNTTSTFLPQGARVALVKIGQPPFSANPKDSLVQIVYGMTKMDLSNGHVGGSNLAGYIKATVVTQSGPSWDLTLPSYGRLPLSPLFDFPNHPGALDLSIPGTWRRPDIFQVDVTVNSPGNDSNHRVDVASPPLTDPIALHWQSGEAVRGIIQRTDLHQEARQQSRVFALGAVVGAGASLVLALFEWVLVGIFGITAFRASHSWRAVRSRLGRAGSRSETKQKPQPGP